MTGKEEAVLKECLLHHGEIENDGDLESWYIKRFEHAGTETHYKRTLHLPKV